ncbi:hypothetical protein BDZ45DRAFT_372678 [Acephala macrosclerotiorum]|nr:hypothetical protein BDZ45DRAFT_372678 [Acephala macrosclerotiorum]
MWVNKGHDPPARIEIFRLHFFTLHWHIVNYGGTTVKHSNSGEKEKALRSAIDLEEENRKLVSQNAELKNYNNSVKDLRTIAVNQARRFKEEKDTVEREFKAIEKQYSNLQAQVADSERKMRGLEERNRLLEEEKQGFSSENIKLQAENNTLKKYQASSFRKRGISFKKRGTGFRKRGMDY